MRRGRAPGRRGPSYGAPTRRMSQQGLRRRWLHRRFPYLGIQFFLQGSIEMLTCPDDERAATAGEQHLKQLQAAHTECGNRAREIKPPGPRKLHAPHTYHRVEGRLKTRQPMFQRLCVVHAQVLDVEHANILGFEHVHGFANRRWVPARENTLTNPSIQRTRTVAANVVQEATSGFANGTLNHTSELPVMVEANVFKHADRAENIELLAEVAVVVFDKLDSPRYALAFGPLARILDLLARDIERLHFHAVVLRHVDGERPPAASNLNNSFAGLQAQLTAHHFQLGFLRRLQGGFWFGEVSTGVEHSLVQPEAIEVVRKIVVKVDVGPRPSVGVVLDEIKPLGAEPRVESWRLWGSAINLFQGSNKVALYLDASCGVGVSEREFSIVN